MDTTKEVMESKEYINSITLALWKTGGVLGMVTAIARKVTEELREDAVSLEVGARITTLPQPPAQLRIQ